MYAELQTLVSVWVRIPSLTTFTPGVSPSGTGQPKVLAGVGYTTRVCATRSEV